MDEFTERNRVHWDSVASSYYDKNEKTIERIVAEVRSRLEWIGVDFLDEDDGDEEDDEIADADERANEERGDGGVIEKKVVRLLDYACGPGTMSRALAPYVSQTLGIDLSSGMAGVYNSSASNQGLSPDEMHAAVGNLLDASNPSPAEFKDDKWFNFDLAVVGFGFHHFEDPTLAATRLAERLKPGGVLMILDFLPHDHSYTDTSEKPDAGEGSSSAGGHSHHHGFGHGHSHDHGHGHGPTDDGSEQNSGYKRVVETVAHQGFLEEDIKKSFEAGGVGKDFALQVIATNVVFTFQSRKVTRTVFLARGTKA